MTLAQAKADGVDSFIAKGEQMLTMAVFAICITAPAGAILIAQLGPRWLTKKKGAVDGDEEKMDQVPIPRRTSQYGDPDDIMNFRKMYHDKDDLNTCSNKSKVLNVESQLKNE